jgi:hypothetical protein
LKEGIGGEIEGEARVTIRTTLLCYSYCSTTMLQFGFKLGCEPKYSQFLTILKYTNLNAQMCKLLQVVHFVCIVCYYVIKKALGFMLFCIIRSDDALTQGQNIQYLKDNKLPYIDNPS